MDDSSSSSSSWSESSSRSRSKSKSKNGEKKKRSYSSSSASSTPEKKPHKHSHKSKNKKHRYGKKKSKKRLRNSSKDRSKSHKKSKRRSISNDSNREDSTKRRKRSVSIDRYESSRYGGSRLPASPPRKRSPVFNRYSRESRRSSSRHRGERSSWRDRRNRSRSTSRGLSNPRSRSRIERSSWRDRRDHSRSVSRGRSNARTIHREDRFSLRNRRDHSRSRSRRRSRSGSKDRMERSSQRHRRKRSVSAARGRSRSISIDKTERSSQRDKHQRSRSLSRDRKNSNDSSVAKNEETMKEKPKPSEKTSVSTQQDNVVRNRKDESIPQNNRALVNNSKKIEIKISASAVNKEDDKNKVNQNEKTDLIGKWEPVEKEALKALTELCKTLTEDKENDIEDEKEQNDSDNTKEADTVRHPFKVKPAPPMPPLVMPTIPMNPAQAIQSGMIHQVLGNVGVCPTLPSEIRSSFPVSSGVQHRQKEHSTDGTKNEPVFDAAGQQVNISTVIADRLQVQTALASNPFNIEAIAKLRDCDDKIKKWSKSGLKPAQFTGEKTKNILTREELEGGYSAWVRKDFFNHLKPIRDGVGLRLLQKMGWTLGQPLGKNRAGFLNPITFEVRTDRRGLSTAEETEVSLKAKRKGPPVVEVQGKHPVSALSELCSKRKWGQADYKLISDAGPPSSKNFLFMVTVNGQDFSPLSPSPNKKNAKAQAATVALQKLGLIA